MPNTDDGPIGASPECQKKPRCTRHNGFVLYCECAEREAETMARKAETMGAALDLIADIAEGSGTVNSLPHIAKIARGARS